MQTLVKIVDIIEDVVDAINLLPVQFIWPPIDNVSAVIFSEDVILWIGAKVILTHDTGTIEGMVTAITDQRNIAITFEDTPETFVKLELRVQYLHGHYVDIMQTLAQWAENPDYKEVIFPLIILKQDIEEEVSVGFQSEVLLDVFICTDTKQEFTAAQRYPATFTPILYPLYQRFFQMLKRSRDIHALNPKHTKIDRVFWGRESASGNTANTLNDFIDAIELQNIEIKILNTC